MTTKLAAITLATLTAASLWADSMGTAFTYQGKLADGGTPANGRYDLQMVLYPSPLGGSPITVTPPAVNSLLLSGMGVTNGFFTVRLDFKTGVFQGDAMWMEIWAATNGSALAKLDPRQAHQFD